VAGLPTAPPYEIIVNFTNKVFRRLIGTLPMVGYERLVRRDVVGLCYHLVSHECPPHVAHLGAFKPLEMFEADLKYLKQHYKVISYEELLRLRQTATSHSLEKVSGTFCAKHRGRSGKRFLTLFSTATRPAVILTFDDGFRECFTHVRPLLLKYELPAIFFITTDFIDNRRLFYRNKVSLCLDRLRTLDRANLATFTAALQRSSLTPNTGHLTSEFDTCLLTPDTLLGWLKNLPITAEATIDEVCELLNIDCQRYLAERQPYLTCDEIKALAVDGFTIGAHSKSHTRLGQGKGSGPFCRNGLDQPQRSLPGASHKSVLPPFSDLASELVDSCRIIAELTGAERVPFAFPFSGDSVDRAQLAEIRQQNPVVDLMFDRRGFRPDADFIVHRIICDRPERTIPARSNVKQLFRRAYCNELTGAK
jgi:peptidoglycan/xylan/chitin deacetylase (PgdA/CDA1 family)